MKCTICEKKFLCLKKYVIHIEYAHNLTNYYKCPIGNCQRLYNRRDNFKRHVLDKHADYQNDEQNSFSTIKSPPKIQNSFQEEIQNNDCEFVEDSVSDNVFDIKSNINKFTRILQTTVTNLVAKLYGNLGLNRSTIQVVVDTISLFLKSGMLNILKDSCEYLGHGIGGTHNNILEGIIHMINILENAFGPLDTEYKRIQYFESSANFIAPSEKIIGVSGDQQRKNNEIIMTLKNHCCYFVPMRHTLKLLLEIPGVFNAITAYCDKFQKFSNDTSCITSLLQGSLWQKLRKSFPLNQIVFPIIVYFDDFESLNPLGSHAGCYKIGSVYFSIAAIPPEYASRLDNIFLSLIFYSGDRVKFGNQQTFDILIQELIFLETSGVDVNIDGGGNLVNVKFCLVALTGDNLGVHAILGLNESFSSTYYCRFCTSSKTIMKTQTIEYSQSLRLSENYEEHLASNLGVKEPCIWNKLPNFHIYENLCCDIMHDIFEGVLRYDMALIIFMLVDEGHFTVERLNSRIKYYTYDRSEKNICPGINKDHLSIDGCIIMSAAEMLCLTRNFAFIIGDLVPDDNIVWKFYLVVLELVDILTSTTFTKSTLEYLTSLIEDHNETYMNLSKQHLKPKFHFLIHYPRIILKLGPPVLLSCMRFEAKHKDLKSVSQKSFCRKNLPFTLAYRHQLKFCYRIIASEGFKDKINFGTPNEIDDGLQLLLQSNSLDSDQYFCSPFYECNGIRYDIDAILLSTVSDDIPVFQQIKNIFIHKTNLTNIYFQCLTLKTIHFHEHFYAYKVEITNIVTFVEITALLSQFPSIIHKVGSDCFVSKLCTS